MNKRIPIGLSNFKKLIEENYYYVDKSLLVKDIDESGEVVLITRPRRFGKTLNLSMLQYYYDISEQPCGHLFNNLAIEKWEKFTSTQGQFPTIFVSFKEIFQSTYSEMMQEFKEVIAGEFERHVYLLDSSAIAVHEKERFQRLRTETGTVSDLRRSLKFLAALLYKHYKKKVIVLIDEYDVPVQAAFLSGFYEKFLVFFKGLLTGVLKDNKNLEKGVVTGILALAKAGVFTGLNNLDVYNLTHARMADKFGFTTEESMTLLSSYGIQDFSAIKNWYNGYQIGLTSGIFNPWSLLKCVKNEGSLESYWANTGDNVLIRRLIARAGALVKTDLETLLSNQTVQKTIQESIIFPDLDHQEGLVWSILLFTGYLTYTSFKMKEGKKVCSLTIPNMEIKYLYKELIQSLFTDLVVGGQVVEFLQALTEGNTEVFARYLQTFVINCMSVHDLSSEEPERSYHLFVLGLLVMLKDSYTVKSNHESGYGRYDISLIPKDNKKNGIVLELKRVWEEGKDGLDKGAQLALDQIIERKYAESLFDQGVNTVIAYGIAFLGKKVCVKAVELQK